MPSREELRTFTPHQEFLYSPRGKAKTSVANAAQEGKVGTLAGSKKLGLEKKMAKVFVTL